jgi:hypothetical protein
MEGRNHPNANAKDERPLRLRRRKAGSYIGSVEDAVTRRTVAKIPGMSSSRPRRKIRGHGFWK